MAATLLDSVFSPRSLTVSSNLSTPAMGSSICAVKARSLPHFRGLKAQHGSPKRSSRVSVRSQNGKLRGGGGVVCESQETTAVEVPEVTEPTWKKSVLESDLPVLVEFWAPWCGPCRMIHPVVDELAKEYSGKLKCFKLNTDESPAIATQYGIRSIPTVMLFKNGEKKDAIVGAVPKTTLTTGIEKFL